MIVKSGQRNKYQSGREIEKLYHSAVIQCDIKSSSLKLTDTVKKVKKNYFIIPQLKQLNAFNIVQYSVEQSQWKKV